MRAQDCPFQLIAGPPTGVSPEGLAANLAFLQNPSGTSFDSAGNIYIADSQDNLVLRVGTDNIIHLAAGTGANGSAGDGMAAAAATLSLPQFVLAALDGTLFISDPGNHRIHRLLTNGTIIAFAGTGHPGFSGDGGGALSAELNRPTGLALDASGNLFIADTNNNRIRKVDSTGTITTVAGSSGAVCYTYACETAGDGGPATSAMLATPAGIAVAADGSLYIADSGIALVRRVSPNGTIQTIAGGGTSYSDDTYPVPARSAYIPGPMSLILEPDGSLLIAAAQMVKLSADGSTINIFS